MCDADKRSFITCSGVTIIVDDGCLYEVSDPDEIVAERLDEFLDKAAKHRKFNFEGEEYTYAGDFIRKTNDTWVASLGDVLHIIKNQDQIVWEKPKIELDEIQLYALEAIYRLWGMQWIMKDQDEFVTLSREKLIKGDDYWSPEDSALLMSTHHMRIKFDDLVSWSDPEPFDIRQALIDNGVDLSDE